VALSIDDLVDTFIDGALMPLNASAKQGLIASRKPRHLDGRILGGVLSRKLPEEFNQASSSSPRGESALPT